MASYKDRLDPDRINIGYTARDHRIDESHYTSVLEEMGANPIRFGDDVKDLEQFVLDVDGMLFTGGDDVSPALYGEKPEPELGPHDYRWDEREAELLRYAHKHGVPTLANCRGLQLMNVALGGTLHQDLIADGVTDFNHEVYPRTINEIVHNNYVVRNSKMGEILHQLGEYHDEKTFTLPVNSSHHQAVDRVAEGLTMVATAFDGVIEALEDDSLDFFMGVQWHPEDIIADRTLHRHLIDHARAWRDAGKGRD